MATCRIKNKTHQNAYNTTYGLAIVKHDEDGYAYYDGAEHIVRDLCIRHKFERCASKVVNNEPAPIKAKEPVEEPVKEERKTKRKPRRAKKSSD